MHQFPDRESWTRNFKAKVRRWCNASDTEGRIHELLYAFIHVFNEHVLSINSLLDGRQKEEIHSMYSVLSLTLSSSISTVILWGRYFSSFYFADEEAESLPEMRIQMWCTQSEELISAITQNHCNKLFALGHCSRLSLALLALANICFSLT